MLEVRAATNADAQFYWEHHQRHEIESGRNGDIVFSPFEDSGRRGAEEFIKSQQEDWGKALSETGWERSWVLTDEVGIYGDLELGQRPTIKSALHRATLTMGIERPYRGQGYGFKLMTAAIGWAKEQPNLNWLQLSVFDDNEPAKALYRKFGFTEVGTTPDMFRVFGREIADTSMILRLPCGARG